MKFSNPVDQAEYDRLETLLASMPMLSTREGSEAYLHARHKESQPCWLCGLPVSQYAAAGTVTIRETADAKTKVPHDRYTCPRCGSKLCHVVPFLPGNRPWYWARPASTTPADVRAAVERWDTTAA